jgi:hypothetical protein
MASHPRGTDSAAAPPTTIVSAWSFPHGQMAAHYKVRMQTSQDWQHLYSIEAAGGVLWDAQLQRSVCKRLDFRIIVIVQD